MKKILLLLLGVFAGMQLPAQNSAQLYLEQMAADQTLEGSALSAMVRDREGRTVAAYAQEQRLVPASNTKLVTTGCALHALGPDFRFKTRLGYSGCIQDGSLEGDLYILGGGDPTLASKDSIATPPEVLFRSWASLLTQAGIRRIHGRIIGDGTAMEGHLEHVSWSYDDIGTYYGTGTNALCFYQNAIDFDVAAGSRSGAPVRMVQTYPETPWMHTDNFAFTGAAGTGNSLYLYTTDLAPYAQLRGSFALDRKAKTEHFSNKYGDLSCAFYFWKYLKGQGWEVSGTYARVDREGRICGSDFRQQEKAARPVEIGSTASPLLRQIARETNVRSDNFYAEALFRTLGEESSSYAVYDSSLVAVHKVLESMGLSTEGIQLADGSGLSRLNYISARWMTDYLLAMRESPAFEAFLASLPVPGIGTLNMILLPGGERIRMKSGSMDGVLCYSGYILDGDGTPAFTFSLLTNNSVAPVKQVRAALVGFLEKLLSLQVL